MLAAIGEELGFVGLLAVAVVFAIIAARGFDAALRAADDYGFFLATVLTLFLTLPVLVMGAGMLGLVPLTGVVTPFLSFGGSAMVANFVALGMLAAIRRHAADGARRRPLRFAPASGARSRCSAPLPSCVLAVLFDVQVVRADAYAARPHLGVQADGVSPVSVQPAADRRARHDSARNRVRSARPAAGHRRSSRCPPRARGVQEGWASRSPECDADVVSGFSRTDERVLSTRRCGIPSARRRA